MVHEGTFADTLTLRVLERPKLSVWMILVPIIFVYFFYRYQRFSTGRKQFRENYMISRKRALAEAAAMIETGKEPDIEGLSRLSSLPEEVLSPNGDVLRILVDHYVDLLRSEGECFDALMRAAYKSKTNYLLFVSQLNRAEKRLNAALEPHLSETTEAVDRIMHDIETHSETIRRGTADVIFS